MSTATRPTNARENPPLLPNPAPEASQKRPKQGNTVRWRAFGPALTDIALAATCGLIACYLRFGNLFLFPASGSSKTIFSQLPHGPVGVHLGMLLVFVTLLVLAGYSRGLYRSDPARSALMEGFSVVQAVTIATVILTAFVYLSGIKTVSRFVVVFTAIGSLLLLSGWRALWWELTRRRFANGIGLRHALIVGAGKTGMLLADYLKANPPLGYEVRGFLDQDHHTDPRVLGKVSDLAEVARREFIDEVFITIPSERELVKQSALAAMRLNLDVKVVPEMYDGLAWQCPLEFVGDVPVRALHREPIPVLGLFLKRMTDVVCSALLLLLLSPLLAMVALVVALDSPGPILYRGYRMGKKGRRFVCYKFRTMVRNADEMKEALRHLNEREGHLFKISDDPRLTRTGSFLRRYSLDELPQLWNVFRGEMSLVGPRPPSPDEFQNYSLTHLRRLDVTPGLTGLWQIEARHSPSFEKAVALDSKYIESWSYPLDLKILLRTIPVVLKGSGR